MTKKNDTIQKKRNKRFKVSAILSVFTRFITIGSTIVTIPLLLNYLGPVFFGVWITLTNLSGYFQFLDFGLGSGLQNRLIKCYGTDDLINPSVLITNAYAITAFIAILLGFLIVFVSKTLSFSFLFNIESSNQIDLSILSFLVLTILGIPISLHLRILSSYQKDYVGRILLIIGRLLSLIFIFISVYLDLTLNQLIIGFTLLPIIVIFIHSIWEMILYPHFRINLLSINLKLMRELLYEGFWFFIAQIGVAIQVFSPSLLIASNFGAVSAAQFGVTQKITSLISNTISGALQPLWPAYGEAFHRKDYSWIKFTLKKSLKTITIITLPLVILLSLFGSDLMIIWLTDKSALPTKSLLLITITGMMFMNFSIALAVLLNGLNLIKMQSISLLSVNAIMTILVSYWGVSYGINTATFLIYTLPQVIIMILLIIQTRNVLSSIKN